MNNKYKNLNQPLVRRLFKYDDGRLIWQSRPFSDFKNGHGYRAYHSTICHKVAGTVDKTGYCSIGIRKENIIVKYLIHRIVWLYHYGSLPKQLDHINGNRLDNRIENLRPATEHQNKRNRYKTKLQKTSKFKGVSYEKDRLKWKAGIKCYNLNKTIGRFTDEITAAQAYDKVARTLFGKYARLNFPEFHEQSAL